MWIKAVVQICSSLDYDYILLIQIFIFSAIIQNIEFSIQIFEAGLLP